MSLAGCSVAEVTLRLVSAGAGEVWCVTSGGVVCRRLGVTQDNPAGTSWLSGLDVSINPPRSHCTGGLGTCDIVECGY